MLVLDADPGDLKWLLAIIALDADVRPAVLDAAGRYTDWRAVAEWVARMTGRPVALVSVQDALAWRIDEGQRPR